MYVISFIIIMYMVIKTCYIEKNCKELHISIQIKHYNYNIQFEYTLTIDIHFSQTQSIHKLTNLSISAAHGQTNTILKASPCYIVFDGLTDNSLSSLSLSIVFLGDTLELRLVIV